MKKAIIKKGNLKYIDLTSSQLKLRKAEEAKSKSEKKAKEYIFKRNKARGNIESQLEFIVENGLDAFIKRDNGIREKYPKNLINEDIGGK